MSREKPPDKKDGEVVYLADYRKKKESKIIDISPSDSKTGKEYARQKRIENAIEEIGREKLVALGRFANVVEVINPNEEDILLAEKIPEMSDESLLFIFKTVARNLWGKQPLSYKILYNELRSRMGRAEKN